MHSRHEIIPNAQQETHFSPRNLAFGTVTADLMSASEKNGRLRPRKVKFAIAGTSQAGQYKAEMREIKRRAYAPSAMSFRPRDDKKCL